MTRLAIFIPFDRTIEDADSDIFPCKYGSALRFAARVGEPVLLVKTTAFGSAAIVALGTIGDVPVGPSGNTSVLIRQVKLFPIPAPFDPTPAGGLQWQELSQVQFDQLVNHALGFSDPVDSQGLRPPPDTLFTERLAALQQNRCSFSGILVRDGMASIIRPIHLGGRWHISNFVFVAQDVAEKFASFAWAIGPRLEVLLDGYAMGPDLVSVTSQTGLLALSDMSLATIDRDALAWHREQFFARLRT